MGLYNDPVLVTLCGGGAGSVMGGGAEKDPIAKITISLNPLKGLNLTAY